MNLNRALERAQAMNFKARANGLPPTGAAQLYADIEYELAMGEPTSEQEQAGEQALAVLEEHYSGIKQRADEVVEHGHIPRMSAKAKDRALGPGRPRGEHPDGAVAAPPRPASVPPRARQVVQKARVTRSRPRRSRSGGGGTAAATRVVKVVSQATGTESWGEDIWVFILGGVGLSILFLILTNSKGLQNLMKGASNLVTWVIDPTVDPLRPTSTGAKR